MTATEIHKTRGALGEEYVVEHLKRKGYQIVERNWHSRYGEIDIIACKDGTLAFVEVKTRKENAIVTPYEAVTSSKQAKIIKTAVAYITMTGNRLQPRFDVAGVTVKQNSFTVDYLENAFDSDKFY